MSSFPSFIGYTSHFAFAYTTAFGFQVILLLPLPLLTSISIQLQQVRTHRSQIVRKKKLYLISLPLNHLQRFQEIKDVFIRESESPTKESFTCGIPSASSDSLPISCKTLTGKISQTKFNWHSALYSTWVEKSKAGILESCCYGDIAFVKYFTKLGFLNEVFAMKFSFSS